MWPKYYQNTVFLKYPNIVDEICKYKFTNKLLVSNKIYSPNTGSKLGLVHVKVVLALILMEYEVSYKKPTDTDVILDPRATFTVAGKGLDMEFRKLVN